MHLCVKCNRKIEDFSEFEKGCECGSRVFIFMKNGEDTSSVKWIEQDFTELNTQAELEDKTIVLDVENIRMVEKGVYHLDLESLLKNPVVIKDLRGIYYIKLPAAPELHKKN